MFEVRAAPLEEVIPLPTTEINQLETFWGMGVYKHIFTYLSHRSKIALGL